jgi:hypothetical protein
MWVVQATRNPFFCFEQALVALSFSQKFLAFRARLIFFRRLNFSGDRLIQFIDGPMRYWFPAHAAFSPWRIKILGSPAAPHSPGK